MQSIQTKNYYDNLIKSIFQQIYKLQIILSASEIDVFCLFYVWDQYFIESSSLNNKKEQRNFVESYHSIN